MKPVFKTSQHLVRCIEPDDPVYCFRREVLLADARVFVENFPGTVAYAVKANADPTVLNTVLEAGISTFDVASVDEMELVTGLYPKAELLFMHPVKTVKSLTFAFEAFGVRRTAVDHANELAKVSAAARAAQMEPSSITVLVRLATEGRALYPLSQKFGADAQEAASLLRSVVKAGFRAGLCFHVGSQVSDVAVFTRAISLARQVMNDAGVRISSLDIGGGFPVEYDAVNNSPEATQLLAMITDDLRQNGFLGVGAEKLRLFVEPGRSIVARSFSVVARVLLRKNEKIYINDGVWGNLSESMTGGICYPVTHIPYRAQSQCPEVADFEIQGVTCDSFDVLRQPLRLPVNIAEGDWIEFGHAGAYSMALRTRFNGFFPRRVFEVEKPFEKRYFGGNAGRRDAEPCAAV